MSKITLAHGGGGRLQNELISKEIASRFANPLLASLPDGALTAEGLVISSDSCAEWGRTSHAFRKCTPREWVGAY